MSPPAEATYEMFWDCKFCGQKKNLGLTHRNCGNCGGPQDPERRYFPPENEKVAVKDHPFVGADLTCHSCNALMSRNVKCCTSCGAPVGAGTDVKLRSDMVVPDGFAPMPAYGGAPLTLPGPPGMPGIMIRPKNSSKTLFIVLGVIAAIAIIGILVAVFWKRQGVFVVADRTWDRTIQIERMDLSHPEAWCDQAPAGARELSRHKEQRGTNKVPDGETCQTRKKDQGNGTYKEVRECTPKYKDAPVMADRCEYELAAWTTSRTADAHGGADDAPRWPDVTLVKTGNVIGAEREAARAEKYTVSFTEQTSGKPASCDVAQSAWSTFTKGAKYTGKMRVATSAVDCDTLVR